MKAYGTAMAASAELLVTLVFFVIAGDWADKSFKLGGGLTIGAAVLGMIIGTFRLIRRLKSEMEP